MKTRLGDIFIGALRILAAAWLGFLVAFLPLYIFRGVYHKPDAAIWEDVLMAAVGIIAGALILMLLIARNDRSAKLDNKCMYIEAGGAVGVYAAAWLIAWLFGGNNYIVAACGYHLSRLIGANEELRPTFWGALGGAVICCAFYMGAMVLGVLIARHGKNKGRNSL